MNDEKLDEIIGDLLRAGVLISAAVVAAGGIAYLVRHHSQDIAYRTFRLGPSNLRTLSGIFGLAGHMHPDGIIQAGLILLIATPIARVVLAAIGFCLEGDRLYVGVSLTVLAVLLFSIVHG